MKNISALLLCWLAFSHVMAQNSHLDGQKPSGRFYLGVNYSYFGNDLKLLDITQQSIWKGVDLGTYELDQEQIDTLNSFVDYQLNFNAAGLEAGMVLLNKPAGKWYVDAKIMVGLSRIVSKTYNTNKNKTDMQITSEKFTPWFGLAFDVKADFGNNWGMKLLPSAAYSWSRTDEIEDNIIPVTEFLEETRKNEAHYLYTRLSMFATYKLNDFTFYTGPGLYLMYNKNEYTVERTDQEEGDTYIDIIERKLVSRSFIDANIAAEWNINQHFILHAMFGIGKDMMVRAGIKYYL